MITGCNPFGDWIVQLGIFIWEELTLLPRVPPFGWITVPITQNASAHVSIQKAFWYVPAWIVCQGSCPTVVGLAIIRLHLVRMATGNEIKWQVQLIRLTVCCVSTGRDQITWERVMADPVPCMAWPLRPKPDQECPSSSGFFLLVWQPSPHRFHTR